MFILIDHADVYSTAKPLEWPPIDGVTTVPTILHREDKELLGVFLPDGRPDAGDSQDMAKTAVLGVPARSMLTPGRCCDLSV